MNIGELSRISGVAAPTIRFYEKIQLLPKAKRHANGYRYYSDDDVAWLMWIQRAQPVGFALEEFQVLWPLDDDAHQHEVMVARLQPRMAEMEAQIQQLSLGKQKLQAVVDAILNKPDDVSCAENAQRLLKHNPAST